MTRAPGPSHGLRHRWSAPVRFFNERGENSKTERACEACGLVKVTMHPPLGLAWREWWKDCERIDCDRTPECVPFTEASKAESVTRVNQ